MIFKKSGFSALFKLYRTTYYRLNGYAFYIFDGAYIWKFYKRAGLAGA